LYIAAVLHARCLLTVVTQVPVFNFCEHFMSITSIIISAWSLWLQLPFQFFHCFFSSIPFLLRLQGKLICGFCARFGLLELHHRLQHIWCIWIHTSGVAFRIYTTTILLENSTREPRVRPRKRAS
jgi:hypothetical protein